jgi:hypothetical protein
MSKYLKFQEVVELNKKRTRNYRVLSARDNSQLGIMLWYGAWRQYVFIPTDECTTIWSAGCLGDVVEFLKSIREVRK